MKGKMVILSAPSGAGKTTIVNYLLDKKLNLEFSISATSREPRGREKNGREYYFISPGNFKKMINDNEFIEWEEVYKDQFYGTPRSEIDRIWSENKHVLFDVDVKGGINLKDIFRQKAISIFIMPPSVEELEKRLKKRATDDEARIRMRITKAIEEIKLADRFDHIVVNDNLEVAQREVYEMVKSFLNNGSQVSGDY
jgi:guanylate kinase